MAGKADDGSCAARLFMSVSCHRHTGVHTTPGATPPAGGWGGGQVRTRPHLSSSRRGSAGQTRALRSHAGQAQGSWCERTHQPQWQRSAGKQTNWTIDHGNIKKRRSNQLPSTGAPHRPPRRAARREGENQGLAVQRNRFIHSTGHSTGAHRGIEIEAVLSDNVTNDVADPSDHISNLISLACSLP